MKTPALCGMVLRCRYNNDGLEKVMSWVMHVWGRVRAYGWSFRMRWLRATLSSVGGLRLLSSVSGLWVIVSSVRGDGKLSRWPCNFACSNRVEEVAFSNCFAQNLHVALEVISKHTRIR